MSDILNQKRRKERIAGRSLLKPSIRPSTSESTQDETKTALGTNDALQGHVSKKSAGMRAM